MGEHSRRRTSRFSLPGRRWMLITVAMLLVVAGMGTAVLLASPSLRHQLGIGRVAPAPEQVRPPALRIGPLAADAPTPSTSGVAGVLDKLAAARQLGTLSGVVLDPTTSQTLWSRTPAKAQVPGSTGKLLTTAAALLALDPTSRLTTRVLAGPTADSVVLVGGGDPTLSALPVGQESVYRGAAKLDTLVEAVRAAHPEPIRTVTIDLSRYTGPTLASGWLPEDVPAGYVTPIESLILDGGRGKPAELDTPRTRTPGLDAGRELAKRLGADVATVRAQPAPSGARVLGEVSSPPIAGLVETALRISDNVLAEALAREVALVRHADPSFSGSTRAVLATLTGAGFEVGDTRMVDGSGLSTADQIPAGLLGQVVAAAAAPTTESAAGIETSSGGHAAGSPGAPASSPPSGVPLSGGAAPPSGGQPSGDPARSGDPPAGGAGSGSAGTTPAAEPNRADRADRAARLRPLLAGLPVAGGDGTLDERFTPGPSGAGRGYVRAKTGTLTGVSSLAGTVTDADGRLMVFAWMSTGTSPAVSRPRLDAMAAALRGCGCR